MTADIPKIISKRLTNISCNKNVFDNNVDLYQAALKNNGLDGIITCNDQSEQPNNVNIEEANQARKRKRAIIWYKPPYSMNVKTNIGKTFFKLLQKHFPPTHPMYTIFNKNKIKISYSCFPNMGSIISLHNKHILNSNNTEYGCNCNNRDKCPLANKCLIPRTIYGADVTNNKTDESKYYYGISDALFKERYENHKTSFNHRSHLTPSDLFKYYGKLVDNAAVPTIKFSIAKHVKRNTFINNSSICLIEKDFIIINLDDANMLNKRSEFISQSRKCY